MNAEEAGLTGPGGRVLKRLPAAPSAPSAVDNRIHGAAARVVRSRSSSVRLRASPQR